MTISTSLDALQQEINTASEYLQRLSKLMSESATLAVSCATDQSAIQKIAKLQEEMLELQTKMAHHHLDTINKTVRWFNAFGINVK